MGMSTGDIKIEPREQYDIYWNSDSICTVFFHPMWDKSYETTNPYIHIGSVCDYDYSIADNSIGAKWGSYCFIAAWQV